MEIKEGVIVEADEGTARPMTPWVKWFCISSYVFMALFFAAMGLLTSDLTPLLVGIGLIVGGGLWSAAGTRRVVTRALEVVGMAVAWLVMTVLSIATQLFVLYLLVRFVKWAWNQ